MQLLFGFNNKELINYKQLLEKSNSGIDSHSIVQEYIFSKELFTSFIHLIYYTSGHCKV